MENILKDTEKYLKEFNDAGYIIQGKIINYAFINFKFYTKNNEFIYQETLWADYILSEKDNKKRESYIISFAKTLMLNAMDCRLRDCEKRIRKLEG